jgi:hypothetical protein
LRKANEIVPSVHRCDNVKRSKSALGSERGLVN